MRELFNEPNLIENLFAEFLDGIVIIDEKHTIAYVNDAFVKMSGFNRDELIGLLPPFPYAPHEEPDDISHALRHGLPSEKKHCELMLHRKDASPFPALATLSAIKNKSDKIIALIIMFKDISEQTHLKETLLKNEQRWRSIAENPFDFVVVINREYKYIYVNHTAPGITEESLVGKKTPLDFTEPTYHPKMIAAFESAFIDGKASYYDVYCQQLDQWFSTLVGPIWENGQVTSISLLSRDITQQKRNEESIRQSEVKLRESHKMETVGTLAGGIAHDLNNILTPILAHSDIALQKFGCNHAAYSSVKSIHEAALRARDLVQRILLFGRRHDALKTVFDINELISESFHLFRATAPASISISFDRHINPLWIYADRTQLNQIIANLVTNALQAMEKRGNCLEIKVSVSKENSSEPDQRQMATIAVTDNGIGMDEETKRRAFDPFYTTKPVGTGTGLGLSIVHGIVREHGGSVHISSVQNQGTTITIQLPCEVKHLENPTLESFNNPRIKKFKPVRVLCIDDEPSILEVLRLGLSQSGHHVTTSIHAKDAQQLLAKKDAEFDIVITDQTMPYMMGTDLIAELRKNANDIPCLLMTGLDDEQTKKQARLLGVEEIVLKPFSLQDILLTIEKATSR